MGSPPSGVTAPSPSGSPIPPSDSTPLEGHGEEVRKAKARFTALLLAACAVYAALNWLYVWNLAAGAVQRSLGATTAHLLLLLVGFFCACFGALALRGVVKWVLAALYVASLASNYAAFKIIGTPPTRQTGVWLYSEIGQFVDMLSVHAPVIALVAVPALLGVLAMGVLAQRIRTLGEACIPAGVNRALRTLALCGVLAVPLVIAATRAPKGLAESNMYAFGLVLLSLPARVAAEPALTPASAPAFEKVILVVDESVTPDAFRKVVSPLLGWSHVDYGTAYSSGNCSAPSQALMRMGIARQAMAGDVDPRTQPSIWAYARRAGFRTVLIDGQRDDPALTQNYMGEQERRLIDEDLAMDIGVDSDKAIADDLARRLRQPGRQFIYVVKRGNHWPYEKNVPAGIESAGMSRQQVYEAGVMASTGRFFQQMQALVPTLDHAVIFYTSDHGQNFDGAATHCSGLFLEEEFEVPMLIMAARSPFLDSLRASAACWGGGANHQSLRSTALQAMGFSPSDLRKRMFEPMAACPASREFPRFRGVLPFITAPGEKLVFEALPFRPPRKAVPARSSVSDGG